jgi:hypothetical protein
MNNKFKEIWKKLNKPLLPGRKPLKIVFIGAACILILMLINNIIN